MAEDLEWRLRQVETWKAGLTTEHEGIMHDLYGNGQKGLRDIILAFIERDDTREEERKKAQDKQEENVKTALESHNNKVTGRYNFLIVVIAALALIVGWLTYIETRHKIGDGSLQIPGISQSGPQNAQLHDLAGPN